VVFDRNMRNESCRDAPGRQKCQGGGGGSEERYRRFSTSFLIGKENGQVTLERKEGGVKRGEEKKEKGRKEMHQ